MSQLIEAIQGVIERTPPQLASDIFDQGIILTGGAAALGGLSEAIYNVLGIPCGVADDPQSCVAVGCAMALEDSPKMRALFSASDRKWQR